MNIVVYDDQKSTCVEVERILTEIPDLSLISCYNKKELNDVINIKRIELLIIDIQLENGLNGIEVATEIKNRMPEIKIIFLTAYGDVYHEQIFFNFQPYGLVTKPIQKNVLTFLVKKLYKQLYGSNDTITFISNYKEYTLPIKEINYIQSNKRACEIVTKNQTYSVYSKISDFESKLDENFLRCHQSFIVNLNYIKSIEGHTFVTIKNKYIPISQKYFKQAEKRFLRHICNKPI